MSWEQRLLPAFSYRYLVCCLDPFSSPINLSLLTVQIDMK